MASVNPPFSFSCVASTSGPEFQGNIQPHQTGVRADPIPSAPVSNYFKSAEWTPDGTSVITNSADNHIRTFILPPDLLAPRDKPLELTAFSDLSSAEPVYATAIYPFFSLQDQTTTSILSSVRDHPIRLSSAIHPTTIATYSHINPTTEAFITPHSILYPPELGGTQFITGSDSLISVFDVNRPGKDGPVASYPTIPSKRKKIVGGGVGMKGIVSSMALSPTGDGILAAGTYTRHIGLYSSNGSGDLLGTFPVAGTIADRRIGGSGITQTLWSPCGRYLYVVERRSRGIIIYDIRVTGQLLGWLEGRKAMTPQRLSVDVIPPTETSPCEIWAGGTDGEVTVWSRPELSVDGKPPDWSMKLHDDPMSSTAMHPMGGVLATSSGQKHFAPNPALDEVELTPGAVKIDNSLKIWSLN